VLGCLGGMLMNRAIVPGALPLGCAIDEVQRLRRGESTLKQFGCLLVVVAGPLATEVARIREAAAAFAPTCFEARRRGPCWRPAKPIRGRN
jgi:hypothetical protein